jgi:hypothetical protein
LNKPFAKAGFIGLRDEIDSAKLRLMIESSRKERTEDDNVVISPFADTDAKVSRRKDGAGKLFFIFGGSVLLIVIGAVVAILLMRYLNNPYRTLEPFPVSKYLDNYQSLAGSKYKADFRVEADLGWKEGAGRLMLFSTTDDSRPIAVLIPASVATGIYFTKGQTYTAEVEVKEGGLIYADSFEKN